MDNTLDTPEFKKVIESGSNDNGSWIKFSDGTMICYISKKTTLENTLSVYGSLFQTVQEWTFPIPFVNIPTVTCGKFLIGTGASWGTVLSEDKTLANLRVIDIAKRTAGENAFISATAIGKWK